MEIATVEILSLNMKEPLSYPPTLGGFHARFASAEEISKMKVMLKASLEAGSIGLSLGLFYCPGIFSHTAELVELCSVMTEYDGVLATHTRGLTVTYDKAVEEVIRVAETNRIPLQLSHHAGGGGEIRKGAFADITLFNPDTVSNKASFADPYRYSEGIETVIVNGKAVLESAAYNAGIPAGKVIRRS